MKIEQGWLFGHPADRIIERIDSKLRAFKPAKDEAIRINEELSKFYKNNL